MTTFMMSRKLLANSSQISHVNSFTIKYATDIFFLLNKKPINRFTRESKNKVKRRTHMKQFYSTDQNKPSLV